MNSLIFPIQTLVGVLSFTALAAVAQDGPGFRAGTAVVDISPTVFPIQLRSGPSDYVHDPLHVRAIAFENGKGRAVIAVVDAIGVGRETCDEAKSIVGKKTGWKPTEMLVCATHTHSAPKGGDTTPGRIAYEKIRSGGIVQALIGAIESLEPAKVGFASDEEPSEVWATITRLGREWRDGHMVTYIADAGAMHMRYDITDGEIATVHL